MPRMQGITRQAWDTCQRCGFVHPIASLVVQKGMKLCTCHGCVDNLTVEKRQQVIAETLASGEELVPEDILQKPTLDQEDINF